MKRTSFHFDSWSKVFLGLNLLLILVQVVVILASRNHLPPLIPLLYSLPWGEGRLVSPVLLWTLPAVSTTTLIVNLVLGQLVRQVVLTRVLITTAFLVTSLSLTTLAQIILIGLT